VAVHDCPIAHSLIGRFSHRLNELVRNGLLPNYHGKLWLDCTVVSGAGAPALQVVIQAITGITSETHPELPKMASTLAGMEWVRSVAYRHRSGEVLTLVGEPVDRIVVYGRPLYLPAGSFSQTNPEMLDLLMGRMRALLEGSQIRAAADVYGGIGTFALALADCAASMTLVELDPNAVAAARRTARERGLSNLAFIRRHAERALPELEGLELAILDPPRSGLGEVVIGALTGYRVPLIMYVSCAPPTLARDLGMFRRSGYSVERLELFDFYPQTYHVEALAVLRT
jgi:23S rRNA (uracil1939-C5)-methyltransferase